MQWKEWVNPQALRRTPVGIIGCMLTGLLCLVAGLTTNQAAHGDAADWVKIDPQAVEFFETKVRPTLANNCYSCHGPSKQKAGLRLDSRAALLKGGESGPVIVDKDPAKSRLIQVVHYNDKIKMPPGDKLKAEQIEALETWVKMGAPWPGDKVSGAAKTAAASGEYEITEEQRRFWSFQPVKKPALPKVKNPAWSTSPIDHFILAKLEARQLTPNKMADRRTLIHRATYDLHGLPPTPAEVDAFVLNKSPDAFAKVVDRLLASPRYGERWGRHWLDVARYADTKGYVFEEDRRYPHAYNYRDWVIRAFNEDLPYDQFIMQQLAADRLPSGDDKRPLAALGFLTLGRRFLNNPPDIIDDRIDVTMRGLQGLTTTCARCHDHKFDPIPTKDYYSLYGVFASSIEPPPQPISPKEISEPYAAHDKKVKDAETEEEALIKAQVALLRERLKKNETLPDAVKDTLSKVREDATPRGDNLAKVEPAFEAEAREKLKALGASLETLRKSYPPKPELAMTMADAPQPVTPRVFRRGNPGNPGDEVPRRFHAILSKEERPVWTSGSGRLELAHAIASKDNPLTARVMANRVWMHHFGAGLVRTPSDFGKQGERPTHPELLDYLAWRFVEDGWSIKKMHRLIMLSSTYQQSSDHDAKKYSADPENRLLWRTNRRRLELEALRDSLLLAAGRLDTKLGGPAVELWQAPFPVRRTVYGSIERQNLPGIFRSFDFASPDSSSAQRFRTTVPQQALFLMNSPLVIEQARYLASRPDLLARADDSIFDTTTYQKGGAVVHTLRETVGDPAFWRALNVYLNRHKFANVETADLQKAMEEASGANLEWFFRQWVYGAGSPKLEIKLSYSAKNKTLVLSVAQTQAIDGITPEVFLLPLEVEIKTAGGIKVEKLDIKNRTENFSIKLGGKPTDIKFDKNEKIPLKTLKIQPLVTTK